MLASVAATGSTVTIALKPHVHTKFCDRKERVCTAAGRVREMESVLLSAAPTARIDLDTCCWESGAHGAVGAFEALPGTEGQLEYQLRARDSGKLVRFRCVLKGEGKGGDGDGGGETIVSNTLEPVEPSMPKLWDFSVVNEAGSRETLKVGSYACLTSEYTGGQEGSHEYWWLRVSAEGVRETLTQPREVPAHILLQCERETLSAEDAADDPRRLLLTEKDAGCTLKAKCRPKSADGRKVRVGLVGWLAAALASVFSPSKPRTSLFLFLYLSLTRTHAHTYTRTHAHAYAHAHTFSPSVPSSLLSLSLSLSLWFVSVLFFMQGELATTKPSAVISA